MFRTASSLFASAASRLRVIPDARDWLECLGAAGVFLLSACAIHLVAGGLHAPAGPAGLRPDFGAILILAAITFVIPALAEECLFRGVFQPKALSTARDWTVSALSLSAFVLWHPVQVWLGLPMAQPVFIYPGFLVLVAILGGLCTFLVHRSGSLWPAVGLHWLVVVGWKLMAS